MSLTAGAEKQAQAYPLSDDDIRGLLGGNIEISPYPKIKDVQNIGELFDNRGRAIIFYPQQSENQGHWTCMIRDGRQIEFFDPYGEPPDAQKDGLSKNQLERMRMDHPDLTRLLEESGCHVIFNKVQLQKMSNDVQTCGRHCVCRLLYYKMPLSRYRQMIQKSGMTPDEFVVAKTYSNLGK
jgi:hypothetical protein